LKQELRDVVTLNLLVGLNEAAEKQKVTYHSQVLLEKVT